MRANVVMILTMVLVFSSLGFAQFTFGPGDPANDCSNPAFGTMTFAASGTYTWVGGPSMLYDNTTGSGPNGFNCIDVVASDVVIDCMNNVIDGSAGNGDIGIYIALGVDNVTIRNCVIQEFGWGSAGGAGHRLAVGNIFVDGATDVVLDSSNLTFIFSSPGLGDHIAYNALISTSGLTLNNSHLLTFMPPVPGSNAAGIAGRLADGSQISAPVDDVTIEASSIEQQPTHGAWIDGDNVQVYGGSIFEWNTLNGLYINGANDYIEGNTFNNNMGTGLVMSNAYNSQVLSNDMIGNGNYGAAFVLAEDVYFFDNNASNNGGGGLIIEESENITAEENEMSGNTDEGIWVESSGVANTDIHILSNIIYDNDYGIVMENSVDSEIDGNEIWDINNAGIHLEGVDPTTVSDNDVALCDQGIYACDVQYVTFEWNEIHDNSNEGFYLEVGCDPGAVNEYITFDNNEIYSNGDDGIYAAYTDYITMTDNQVYGHGSSDGAELYWCYAPEIYSDNNFSLNSDNGLYLNTWCDDAVVYDNTFSDNDFGFRMYDGFNLYLYDNRFWDNDGSAGAYIVDSDTINIYDNEFLGNSYGVYADPTTSINITGNTINDSTNSGIYYDTIMTSYIYNNYVGYSGDDGIEITASDSVDIIDNVVEETSSGDCVYIVNSPLSNINGNTLRYCDSDGIELDNAEFTTIDPNYIHDCGDNGIYVAGGSDSVTIDGNFIYDNQIGLYMEDGLATVTNNEVYDNDEQGIYLDGAYDGVFEDNIVYDNGYSGYYLDINANGNTFTDDVLYGNGYDCVFDWDPECYGFYIANSDDPELINVVSRDSWAGVWFSTVNSPILTDVRVYGNTEDSLYMEGATNIDFTRVELYNNGGYGFYFDSASTGTMTDCTVHDNGPAVYGIELYGASDITADNLQIYNHVDAWLYVESGSTLDTTDLTIGYNTLYGADWPPTTIFDGAQNTDIYDTNFLIGPDFVSMDSTDPDTDEMNVAGVTLRTQVGGCTGITYYHAAGFPADADEVIATGAPFTPGTKGCVGSVATYEASLNFSGYTAGGTLSSSGGSSAETKRMTVESEILCPGDEVELTVTHSGSPVVGVNVELTQYNPYMGVVASGTTDSNGKVTLDLPASGVYRAHLSKSGYTYLNPYVFEHSLCSGMAPGACRTDSGCAPAEACVAGSCVALTGDCGYASGHVWIDYGCCSNADCAAGTSCVGHVCMSPEEEVHEGAPGEGTTPPGEVIAEEDADAAAAALTALDEATGAIWEADQAGKDTTAAKAKFMEAQNAYNSGDYAKAKELAEEAKRLANEAAAPAEGAIPEAGVEGQPTAGQPPAASSGGPGMLLIIVGVVILIALGAGAYWLLGQGKPKGGYKPKGGSQ
ncbi:MAG: right-handed parallel beta-helix repeat-containing protein [Candidatus Micrarchaeota archaeon]